MEGLKYINPHEIGCFWHNAAEKYGSPNIKWCEESLCQVISEPANTWSNLMYIILGIILIFQFRNKSKSLRLFGPLLFMLGVGSYYYHMANFYIAQICDFLGMFVVMYWFVALNLQRLNKLCFKKSVVFMIAMTVISSIVLHYMYLNGIKYQLLIVVGILLVIITEAFIRKKDKNYSLSKLVIGMSLIAIGEVFSILDMNRALCDPTNHFFQGHALWHILCAIGLYLGCLFYKQFDNKFK